LGCAREVRLPGGFRYRVRRAAKQHTCSRCRRAIAVGEPYVEERPYRGTPRRYHAGCFGLEMGHRVRVVGAGGELCLSTG
jgi:hypothetical protein